jgi:hypothetical protein
MLEGRELEEEEEERRKASERQQTDLLKNLPGSWRRWGLEPSR